MWRRPNVWQVEKIIFQSGKKKKKMQSKAVVVGSLVLAIFSDLLFGFGFTVSCFARMRTFCADEISQFNCTLKAC